MATIGSSLTSTLAASSATTPTIYNLSAPVANTEVSQALSSGTKQILIRSRNRGQLQFAFVSGESSTNFVTVRPNGVYNDSNLNLSSTTLYVQSTVAGDVIEILEWT